VTLRTAGPDSRNQREIRVTLSPSGPRYVSGDAEFAVWNAILGEESDGEAISLTGPLGHVTAGEQLVCAGAFLPPSLQPRSLLLT